MTASGAGSAAASSAGPPAAHASAVHVVALAGGFLVAVAVRAVLLPTPGFTGDLDQFVVWVNGIATGGLGRAYDQDIAFPPVMVYVWALLAAIEPAFRTVTESGDPAIRALMKLPASAADLALAAGVGWALRARPTWAVVAALGIALHPAVVDISAWWGQYESLYALGALVAFLLATNGRPALAAVALGVAAMTKPQALPLVVPFAAWYVGRLGWVRALRYGAITAATVFVLWLPFLAANGPLNFLRNLAEYQGGIFAVLSLRAWNPWWLVQEAFGRGEFIAELPVLRLAGYAAAGVLALVVFLVVRRTPTPRTLALGLAAISLGAFVALTTMHERYAFATLVFLAVLLPDRRVLALWLAFGVVFTLNLLAAVPPTPAVGAALPVFGVLGIAGSVAMTVLAASLFWLLLRERPAPARQPAAERGDVPAQVVG
jgi:dolichyl-phosphate-mannose-protein mannosyltransferase